MRGVSLGSIRARAQSAGVRLPDGEQPPIIHWTFRYERCPSCAPFWRPTRRSWPSPRPALIARVARPGCSIGPTS